MTTIPAGTDGFPTNVQAEPPLQGQLDTPVQDRSIPHFFISEVELAMLETQIAPYRAWLLVPLSHLG